MCALIWASEMKYSVFVDMLALSQRMVFRNRRRYKFAVFAIALGVAGFIILLNVSDAIDQEIGRHLLVLGGATIIDVERHDFDSHHPGEFHDTDISHLEKIPHVMEVGAIVSVDNVEVSMGSIRMMARLAGVDKSFWNTIMASCEKGRLIDDEDVKRGSTVCVLGTNVARDIFGPSNPVGGIIHIANNSMHVIGVLGGIQGPDSLRSVFIPLSTARRRFEDMYSIKHLRIRVDHWEAVETVAEAAKKLLSTRHSGQKTGLRITYYPQRISRVKQTVDLVKALIYLVCFGGIGIGAFGMAYMMIASVRERTREIGLKKAIGAKDFLITLEFLFESFILCAFGGMAGVLTAILACFFLKAVMGFNIEASLLLMTACGGLLLTALIGILSGLYPASMARQMSPVRAMRFE